MEATVQVVSKIHTRFIPQTETWKVEALINISYMSAHNSSLLRSQHNGHGPGETCPHSRNSDVSKLIQLFHLNPIFDMDTNAGTRSQLQCVCVVCTIEASITCDIIFMIHLKNIWHIFRTDYKCTSAHFHILIPSYVCMSNAIVSPTFPHI